MNLSNYLDRINYSGPIAVSAEVLKELHACHTLSVPFENLDIHDKVPIRIDTNSFYNKIVANRRGGFCYEMNGLFNKVLSTIGFKTFFISCNVYVAPLDIYGADFGHVAIVVDLGDLYLADVGFGDAFLEPLRIVFDVVQEQYGCFYKFSKITENEILLEKSVDGRAYSKMFKFTLKPRLLNEFADMCLFHQTSERAPFTKQRLISLPIIEGRVTLTEKLLVETKKGIRQETIIDDEDAFRVNLKKHFNMVFE